MKPLSEDVRGRQKERSERNGVENDITARDIAAFEVGIKLGALYHQFIGMPINSETVSKLERMIERSVSLQPFVRDVCVRIDRDKLHARENIFGYCELQGDMIDVQICVSYDDVEAHACIQYDEKMGYPLMCLRRIIVKRP